MTFTAMAGYVIYSGFIDFQIIKLALGVFILAGGASALNEFQERKLDAKMERTRYRPIPSGKISPRNAFVIAILFILTGLVILFFFSGLVPALLGLFNIIWYNLFYTNLKKINHYAVVPGSLTGAVPALIGWTAAGGYIFESTIMFISFFLFIWQIPHFWLLMLKYGKEYEVAGFPSVNQKINGKNLKRIIYAWIVATSVFSLMLPLFVSNISIPFFLLIFVFNILFVALFTKLSFGKLAELNLKKSFISINIYMFLFLVMVAIYSLFAN